MEMRVSKPKSRPRKPGKRQLEELIRTYYFAGSVFGSFASVYQVKKSDKMLSILTDTAQHLLQEYAEKVGHDQAQAYIDQLEEEYKNLKKKAQKQC